MDINDGSAGGRQSAMDPSNNKLGNSSGFDDDRVAGDRALPVQDAKVLVEANKRLKSKIMELVKIIDQNSQKNQGQAFMSNQS